MNLDRVALRRILGVDAPAGIDSVRGVTHDSRAVEPGFAFVAVPGFRLDGVDFVPEALRRGAVLVVAEREVPDAPAVVVPDVRAALAALAGEVFDRPSEQLDVYGVTGTNGKTTTSYALYSILSGIYGVDACGLSTTAEIIVGGEHEPALRTTPEAPEVQSTLARMRASGASKAVMEVSSHGIALQRVTGTRFAGAVFTNLTRDHLDLHGTMEEYFRAKRQLFVWAEGPKLANAEDEWGRRLAAEIPGTKTFGGTPGADYHVQEVRAERTGTRFDLCHAGDVVTLHTPLLGSYNVLNVAGAAALALEIGADAEALVRAVRGMAQVPGRFERVGGDQPFEVIIDYAHTDVGLAAVLEVARGTVAATDEHAQGRVICVFGAAGDRDKAKRPLMGQVASRLADRSIITTDDAYSEDPQAIADEVAAGADSTTCTVVVDRRQAIRQAIDEALPGDVVVVAGKGHERVQHLPDGDVEFHDATVVAELLAERNDPPE